MPNKILQATVDKHRYNPSEEELNQTNEVLREYEKEKEQRREEERRRARRVRR